MTLLSYEIFCTVTEQGSFRKAADILGLTPSAVSHAVAAMEQELGSAVFVRSRAGVTLTNYGEKIFPYINAVLRSDESFRQAVSELNGLTEGSVKVACFSSVCTAWLPDIIRNFGEMYPGINIELFEGTYADVRDWLKGGVADIGFLSVSSAGDLPIEPLYRDPLLCVVPKGFKKKSKSKYMTVDDMRDQIFVSQRESTDADIANFMEENDLSVRTNFHVVDDLATVAVVQSGLGICMMPELTIRDIHYDVDTYRVYPKAWRIIGIASANPDVLSPAARALYGYIIKNYKEKK